MAMKYVGQTSEEYSIAALDAFTKYNDSIFPSEKDFLRHLFTVLGNGYQWINGALIADVFVAEEQEKRKKSKRTITDWYYSNPKTKTIYRLCEHSKICNIPKNIRPDWLDACKRAIKLFKEEYQMTDNDEELLDIAQETVEKIESERGQNGKSNS